MKKFIDVLVEETLPVGTIVRVKKDLKVGKIYDGVDFVEEMSVYKGCVTEIKISDDEAYVYVLNHIKPFGFTNSMLEREVEIENPTIDDLKTGMLVQLAHGSLYMVFKGTYYNDFIGYGMTSYNFRNYNNDLTNKREKALDIIKIYETKDVPISMISYIQDGTTIGYKETWHRKSFMIEKAQEEVDKAKVIFNKAKEQLEIAENNLRNI
jgi:hypothetical protein